MRHLPAQLRAALALALLAILTLFAVPTWAQNSPAPDDARYVIDERGRRLRVVFPLHDRTTFDVYGTTLGGEDFQQTEFASAFRFAIHHSFEAAFPDEEIWWRFRHRWFSARAIKTYDDLQLGMTLISASYMRHARNNHIVIPSANNARLPAPFDIAFEYDLFDVNVDARTPRLDSVDVAEFAFLLDVLRDPTYRHRLAIGPVLAYGIDRIDGTSPQQSPFAHTIIPASGGRLIYRWENLSGRTALDARLQCAAAALLIDRDMRWQRLCDIRLQAEHTVLAINDRPLSIFLNATFQEEPGMVESGGSLRWGVGVGVRLSLPGDGSD
ncbi:hypothetical protein FRC96_12455 [Lujinxingia vulgaris]|uniref:Uncharacterized protein n=1 Tax=Lujinxingia vulgaris TaxID=2600176 RepID=A0A5C6X720_9DELT|nr:hypothetical protein [Lujinxingia vulgaris]TXD34865.1 hypothetical protein FRC96_12455 [Lujinxingia vulgaris]